MGAAWTGHPSWELIEKASAFADRDIAHLLLDAGADELTETRNAQLATFALSLVILDALKRLGLQPAFVAGHSLGEYTALVATGALSFEEGCQVVVERGEAMQGAAADQPGTMYAILGLSDAQVDVACHRADGDVWVANYNADGQVVIAGSQEALARAGAIAKELGAKRALPLPVGGAFHTPYMASARARLRKALAAASFSDPKFPIVANVDGTTHRDGNEWADLCSAQLCSPVRWRQSVEHLVELGTTSLIEVGPGNVLTGLAKRISPKTKAHSVATPDDLDRLVEALAAPPESKPEHPRSEHDSSETDLHDGEHLFIHERLIVSQSTGLYSPVEPPLEPATGSRLTAGTVVGLVGESEVRTPFAGTLMGILALVGERITPGQPIAWLRTDEATTG